MPAKARPQQSIIYLMQPDERAPHSTTLATAQVVAIEQQLPLAVAFCFDASEQEKDVFEVLEALLETETALSQKQIPLMVLVGEREQRLKWFFDYVQPKRVFDKGGIIELEASRQLSVHPFPWPGQVITIRELQKLVDNNQLTC